MESEIMRLPAGILNAAGGDDYIGSAGGQLGPSRSHFAGQLGRTVWIPPDQIIYNSALGTVYGGRFRYVKLRAADAVNAAIGQIAFWDTTVTSWQQAFQVTTDEDLASTGIAARFPAGIFINTLTYGKYWLIQDMGIVPVKFRTTLAQTGVIGSGVFCAALDTGIGVADNACADVITPNANPTTFTDNVLMRQRYLGTAIAAPVGGALSAVALALPDLGI